MKAPEPHNFLYKYQAQIIGVTDGDTVTALVDLGFGVWKHTKIRLYGINAPELHKGTSDDRAAGNASMEYLRKLILKKTVVVDTIKDKTGKYGRMLAVIYYEKEHKDGKVERFCVNELMIKAGHAVPAQY